MNDIKEPTLTLEETKATVAKLEHPRVTEEHIKNAIWAVRYLADGATTICIIEMDNGFKFIGTSTPADERNFNPDVGQRYAYENAFRQIWTHEGYLLRTQLHTPRGSSDD
jgi:hypothetical protein